MFRETLITVICTAILVLVPFSVGDVAAQESEGVVTLKHKVYRTWDFSLPAEAFVPVGTSVSFGATMGRDFGASLDGTTLVIDSDGDGEVDTRAEGEKARVTLRGTDSTYSMRLVNRGEWYRAPGGMMIGKIEGKRIRLIDQNNNGSYSDMGKDAMIIGRRKVATFLSRVVNIDGRLFEIDPSSNGTSLKYRPFEGPSGSLSLAAPDNRGKILSAILKSEDGLFSFDLSGDDDAFVLPAGNYSIEAGSIGLGESRVQVRRGRSEWIRISAGQDASASWGGPVLAEFAYRRKGGSIDLSPSNIWYYGVMGEEYFGWAPNGKSPKILVSSRKTGRQIAEAYFPGSC